jgi:hypothetical protein
MFVLVRALTYATLFIGLVLVLLPAQLLSPARLAPPEGIGGTALLGAALLYRSLALLAYGGAA